MTMWSNTADRAGSTRAELTAVPRVAPTAPDALARVRRSLAPLRERVLEELREAIIAGRLAPGARLIERELIAMMGVSRTVIREALRQLESEGLIAGDAKKGMVVRALTSAEAKDLYAIRAQLEGLAARLFVENAGHEDLSALVASLKDTVLAYEGGDPNRILRAKNDFYRRLFDGAGSETLSSMLGMLHARIWRWRALGLSHDNRSPRRSRESVRALQALITAIRVKDAARAESIMREESNKAAAEVMRLLASTPENAPPRPVARTARRTAVALKT